MSAPQGPYRPSPGQPNPGPPPPYAQPAQPTPVPAPNPPPRLAPTATPAPGAGRQALAIVAALGVVLAMAAVMAAMQLTWGQLWWQWPRGAFNTPRLVMYATVVAGIACYALAGRLLARGAMYAVGLVLVVLGGVFSGFVWFLASLFTGLRL